MPKTRLARDVVRILEYELSNYHKYKIQLTALQNRTNLHGIEGRPVTSAYVKRIEDFCDIVDRLFCDLPEKKCDLINQIYFHKIYTISRYAVLNYIDITTAYRWRNDFLDQLALEMGY